MWCSNAASCRQRISFFSIAPEGVTRPLRIRKIVEYSQPTAAATLRSLASTACMNVVNLLVRLRFLMPGGCHPWACLTTWRRCLQFGLPRVRSPPAPCHREHAGQHEVMKLSQIKEALNRVLEKHGVGTQVKLKTEDGKRRSYRDFASELERASEK